jgi:prepilin-type N-terminal cleavage/methylation domain-containing protein
MIIKESTIRIGRKKRAFTLVEVIIAASIFTAISTLAAIIFINVLRAQRQISLENAIYEDSRFLMERISREIRQNTIDYDEYYNRVVEKNDDYGTGFGCYASRFYNPGSDGPGVNAATIPANSGSKLGAYCSIPVKPATPQSSPGCTIDKGTLDINTGQNPFAGNTFGAGNNLQNSANAFCDKKFMAASPDCTAPAEQLKLFNRDKLYLIDSSGRQKTILALKNITTAGVVIEKALAMVKIIGKDISPADGIYESWYKLQTGNNDFYCAPGYDCPVTPAHLDETLTNALDTPANLYKGFVPISPLRTKVTDLRFYVSPLEDPRKAFAETTVTEGIMQQPHITVVLTVEPAESQLGVYTGTPPSITLQSTITSRVYNEIQSYDGVSRCKNYAP